MAREINIGGVSREMTTEEKTELDAMQVLAAEGIKIQTDALTKAKADKASGNQKLKDLGLTDDEITALVG